MTKKAISYIIKPTVISLFFLVLLPVILALEIQLNAPDSVNMNEEFKASIRANTQEVYDVKIFVEGNSSKTISQIFNIDKWQSSYYYIKQAFPAQSEFSLKITKAGNWEICARLRKEAQNPSPPVCSPIIVKISNEEESQDNKDIIEKNEQENLEEPNKNEENNIKNESNLESNKEIVIYNINKSDSQINNPIKIQEKIILNNPKKKEQPVFTTKYEKLRNGIVYSFIALCIIIIALLALKRL